MRRPQLPPPDERDSGASLLIALGVMVGIGLLVSALLAFVNTSLRVSGGLDTVRNKQYAADAATEQAIAYVRTNTNALLGSTCGSLAFFTTIPATINGFAMRVDCQGELGSALDANRQIVLQRNVVFTACLNTGAACTANTALLKTKVNFQANAAGQLVGTVVQAWSVSV